MQKQQIRENKMKKGLLALSAATLFVMTTPVQAKQEICVFDLLGKAAAGPDAERDCSRERCTHGGQKANRATAAGRGQGQGPARA